MCDGVNTLKTFVMETNLLGLEKEHISNHLELFGRLMLEKQRKQSSPFHLIKKDLLGRTLLGVITETADKYDWHTFSHWVFNGANKLNLPCLPLLFHIKSVTCHNLIGQKFPTFFFLPTLHKITQKFV